MARRWNGRHMAYGDLRRKVINLPAAKKKAKEGAKCKKSSSTPSSKSSKS